MLTIEVAEHRRYKIGDKVLAIPLIAGAAEGLYSPKQAVITNIAVVNCKNSNEMYFYELDNSGLYQKL